MGKPYGIELRERVVALVEAGHTHRATAAHFRVSIKFVNDMVKLKRETGSLAAKVQGNGGRGKLTTVADWVDDQVRGNGNLTLAELADALYATHGIRVHQSSLWRLLGRLGLTHKKRLASR